MGRRPRVLLLGKQGAGKGTQANLLARHYDIAHLSTGDLFRAQAQAGTAFGLEAKRYMDAGELVPDDIVMGVVEECLAPGGPMADGFILDGFPRTQAQAEALDRVLDGRPLGVVVHLDVPREVVVERLSQRRVCERDGSHIYSVTSPPKVNWTCDICGGKVVQRADDTPEAIERRLDAYERETRPVREYYRDSGVPVVTVDGVGPTDDVFDRLVEAIDGVVE
jgi:adenylate kinase